MFQAFGPLADDTSCMTTNDIDLPVQVMSGSNWKISRGRHQLHGDCAVQASVQ